MKKLFSILLAGVILCSAVSCGSAGSADPAGTASAEPVVAGEAAPENTEPAAAASGYICTFDDGTAIEMGAAAADVLAKLGDPLSVAEAPSCIHEGTDRVYTFNGYTLTTSPDADGTDRIYEVALVSDAVTLEGGVYIGAELAKAEALFGTDYTEQFGVLQYSIENVKVSVVLDGDSCISSLVITAEI